MKKVLYITILACSTLWGSCTCLLYTSDAADEL